MKALQAHPTPSQQHAALSRAGAVLDFFGRLPKILLRATRSRPVSLVIDTESEFVSIKENYLR